MKIKKPLTTLALVILILVLSAFTFLISPLWVKCYLLPAGLNNIHCYYGVESIAYENPKWAMKLCAKMSNVPKKDRCYETIAKQIANKNYSLAAANCNKIRGFSGVHSIEDCYGTISEKAEKE